MMVELDWGNFFCLSLALGTSLLLYWEAKLVSNEVLMQVFEDAYKSQLSIVILDDIER